MAHTFQINDMTCYNLIKHLTFIQTVILYNTGLLPHELNRSLCLGRVIIQVICELLNKNIEYVYSQLPNLE